MCQPLAPTHGSQAMVISRKGAKTLGSKSLKPLIDACAHIHTCTSTHTHCACGRGWCLSREAEFFERGSYIPEQGRE